MEYALPFSYSEMSHASVSRAAPIISNTSSGTNRRLSLSSELICMLSAMRSSNASIYKRQALIGNCIKMTSIIVFCGFIHLRGIQKENQRSKKQSQREGPFFISIESYNPTPYLSITKVLRASRTQSPKTITCRM